MTAVANLQVMTPTDREIVTLGRRHFHLGEPER